MTAVIIVSYVVRPLCRPASAQALCKLFYVRFFVRIQGHWGSC